MKLRPKVLIDVKGYRFDVFQTSAQRLNLSFDFVKRRRIFKNHFLKWFLTAIIVFFVSTFSLAAAPTGVFLSRVPLEERRALEAQLKELEAQMAEQEETISAYQRQGRTLRGEIRQLDAQIAKIRLQVRSINLTLASLDKEIGTTSRRIQETEGEINNTREVIASTLQNIYENKNQNLLQIFLQNPQLSDFFGNLNDFFLLQENLQIHLKGVVDLREDFLNQKEQLSLQKTDTANLKFYQESQARQANKLKQEKDNLLRVTRGQEESYQRLLRETRKTVAEIRNRLFAFLGGGQMTFEQAFELARHAEQITGTRAALILAVLDRESGMGRNVGQCDYRTAMHPRRDIPIFLEIISELGLMGNLEAGLIKVSCPIVADGAFGGAMGPAQFIPSTWNMYKDQIARLTGNNPPSPWRNIDAITGTGLYLMSNYNSSACIAYSQQNPRQPSLARERCAAAMYYSGRRWRTFRWAYGEPVVQRANRFQRDIDMMLGT